jgi:hypothetical protein
MLRECMMSTAEERADMKANPLPQEPVCSTCRNYYVPEAECILRDEEDNSDRCEYLPDSLHDDTLPSLEQAFNVQAKINTLQEELTAYQKRYSALLENAVTAKIEKEGRYALIDKKRSVRIPDVTKFKERFGDEYAVLKQELVDAQLKKIDAMLQEDLTTIPVKRAEELIGKTKLTAISEEKIYHSCSIAEIPGGCSS